VALKREIAAAVAIPIVLAVLFLLPPIAFDFLAALVALAALWEFYRLAERSGHPVAKTVGFLGGIAVFSVATLPWSRPESASVLSAALVAEALFAVAFLAVVAPLFGGVEPVAALAGASSTTLGVLIITLPASAMCSLRAFSPRAVLFLFLVVWSCDSFAYYTGKNFGRRKLAPRISPNKTWEGTVGGFLGATLVGAAAGAWWVLPELGPGRAALAAAVSSSAGQIGDLVESMWKRGAGVKDSGVFLPGHGGFYDRVDSLLFAAPVLALFLPPIS
jgi:phosphatidate cytidylyltransferase